MSCCKRKSCNHISSISSHHLSQIERAHCGKRLWPFEKKVEKKVDVQARVNHAMKIKHGVDSQKALLNTARQFHWHTCAPASDISQTPRGMKHIKYDFEISF